MRLGANKINNGKLNDINEDNFLDFLEDMQEFNNLSDKVIENIPIENNSFTNEVEINLDNDAEFKQYLVKKVMNDITNINLSDLESEVNELKKQDFFNYDDLVDNFAISFNQFMEENLTPKFDIKTDMTQLYNLNNFNEMENLKKQTTFNILNEDSLIQEIKSETTKEKITDPNLLSNLEFNSNESLSFIKDENDNYVLLVSINGEKNIIKTYKNLKSKNLSIRLKEDDNGIKTYVLRANSYKYLAKLNSNTFEIIYEL